MSELFSSKPTQRLEQITALRARIIGDRVNLLQLVVCEDQSARKSSVLEGITGLPFPRQDGICTRFATEIILQHTKTEMEIWATILLISSRSEKFNPLRGYKWQLKSFNGLPTAIAEAGSLMAIRDFGDIMLGPAFARPTPGHHRMFPSRLAMRFHDLTSSALNGAYHEADAVFFRGLELTNSTRLRAMVHHLNTEFANFMSDCGEKRKIVDEKPSDDDSSFEASQTSEDSIGLQILAIDSEIDSWVKEISTCI